MSAGFVACGVCEAKLPAGTDNRQLHHHCQSLRCRVRRVAINAAGSVVMLPFLVVSRTFAAGIAIYDAGERLVKRVRG